MKNHLANIVLYSAMAIFAISSWILKSRISRKYDFEWAGFYATPNGIRKLISVGKVKLDRKEKILASVMVGAFLTIPIVAVWSYW